LTLIDIEGYNLTRL